MDGPPAHTLIYPQVCELLAGWSWATYFCCQHLVEHFVGGVAGPGLDRSICGFAPPLGLSKQVVNHVIYFENYAHLSLNAETSGEAIRKTSSTRGIVFTPQSHWHSRMWLLRA